MLAGMWWVGRDRRRKAGTMVPAKLLNAYHYKNIILGMAYWRESK
jgi:hypothetical protein